MKNSLFAILFFITIKTCAQGSLEGDRLALVALYNATDGVNWTEQSGWSPESLAGTNPCGWYGVTCNGGRVTELDLNICGLNGNIPPEIGNLDQLKTLILGWFFLATNARSTNYSGPYGPIPTEIGNLTNLEHLDLSGDTDRSVYMLSGPMPITGPLPASLGNLTKLTYLDLSFKGNDMQYQGAINGSIPKELGNLVQLKYLDLSAQKLTGTIPGELGDLVNIEHLGLQGPLCCDAGPASKLTGPIPDLSGIPTSAAVFMAYNAFTFDGLETNATKIDHYGQQAHIPSYMQLGKLYVEAGGTPANNTYKWYKRSAVFGAPQVLEATIIGDNHYQPTGLGIYYVTVTNSMATQLTLQSMDYSITSLPVTLAGFSAIDNRAGNLLTWQTTSETNNAGFEIERSTDARKFEKIGFVDGDGDSREDRAYTFTDMSPLATSYYRLKQLDFDGQFEYSRIISVKRASQEISIYPNPASDHFGVKDLEQKQNVVIRNLEGKVMLDQTIIPKQIIDTSHLSKGLYTITVGDKIRKLIIQQ